MWEENERSLYSKLGGSNYFSHWKPFLQKNQYAESFWKQLTKADKEIVAGVWVGERALTVILYGTQLGTGENLKSDNMSHIYSASKIKHKATLIKSPLIHNYC